MRRRAGHARHRTPCAVLHEPHVVHLALLVRLAPADGDEEPVAVGRIDDVDPAQGAHFAAPHSGHEQQPREHRIETPTIEGDLVGLDTAPAPPRPVAGGEHGGQIREPRTAAPCPRPRSPAVRRYPASTRAVRSPAGVGCLASFARKHAAATAIEALEEARSASGSSARLDTPRGPRRRARVRRARRRAAGACRRRSVGCSD